MKFFKMFSFSTLLIVCFLFKGSTIGTTLTQQWQQSCAVKDELIFELMPNVVNYDTGERRVRPYNEFFAGERETNFQSRIQLAEEAMGQMADYSVGMSAKMSDYLVEVLREWSTAKSVFIDLEARIEAEKEKIRRTMDAKIAALGKELNRQQILNEKTLEKTRGLEKKINEYVKMEIAFKECQSQLDTTQWKLGEANEKLRDLHAVHNDTVRDLQAREHDIVGLNEEIARLQEIIANLHRDVENLTATSESLDAALQSMTAERDDLNVRYFILIN